MATSRQKTSLKDSKNLKKTKSAQASARSKGSKSKGAKPKTSGKPYALVIVESPAKAKTIGKYLGNDYQVAACMGHVRDLPPKKYGVDIENNFAPTYTVLPGRRKLVGELTKMAAGAQRVFLATDLDREGEAIAWHLSEALKLPASKISRVVFNEITKRAISQAFTKPGLIALDKVNAQQARRILDRIVGYELSPLLWKKIMPRLSAGRVQSVAVRLLVEREQQIQDFKPDEYWRVSVALTSSEKHDKALDAFNEFWKKIPQGSQPDKALKGELYREHRIFQADVMRAGAEPFRPENQEQAETARSKLERSTYRVHRLKSTKRQDRPAPPFTTVSLQQQASVRLRFRTSRTMRIAQQLYEGVEIPGHGPVGLITYMRTDSTHLANEAVSDARGFISEQFGPEYLPDSANRYASASGAQQAHEAVRPTQAAYTPESIRSSLSPDQFKLYELIWKRFIACQMKPGLWQVTTVDVQAKDPDGSAFLLRASGRALLFDGHLKVSGIRINPDEQILPTLAEEQNLHKLKVLASQHFTQPPPRYSEASLVKALEAKGIGRPSTYAAIIDTITKRDYAELRDRRFIATDLGKMVTEKLIEHFPRIMDVSFTSHMEEQFDHIEDAHLDWVGVLREFYTPFRQSLDSALNNMTHVRAESKPSDYTCRKCDQPMVYRWSKSGRYLACSDYPDCKTTLPVDKDGQAIETTPGEVKCPNCGQDMILRQGRYGLFLGCSGYPECKTNLPCDEKGQLLKTVKEEDIKKTCELCGKPMAVRRKGRRAFLGCTGYPECDNTSPLPEGIRLASKPKAPAEPAGIDCEKCGKPMVIRSGRRGKFIACSGFPRCRNTKPLPQNDEDKDEEKKKKKKEKEKEKEKD
ncbi:MAG: type I DNA topoisomerase [Actinobacteria bacterium]|nr:type I DNA topoisomerase [Actinomycetota bacterium]